MNKILLLIFSISTVVYTAQRVVSREPGRIVVEMTFDSARIESGPDEDPVLSIPNAGDLVMTPDSVQLPAASLNLALPHERTVDMELRVRERGRITLPSRLHRGGSTYSSLPAGAHIAPVLHRSVRGIDLQTLLISPFQWQDGAVSGSYIRRAEIVLTYDPVDHRVSPDESAYTDVVRASVLNPDEISRSTSSRRRAGAEERSYIRRDQDVLYFEHSPSNDIRSEETAVENYDGVYRFTPEDLQPLGSDISLTEITVQASNRTVHSAETPEFSDIPESVVDVPVVVRDKNNDGVFNGDDELLIYAESVHYWYYDDALSDWFMEFNDFDYRRFFWIHRDTGTVMDTYSPDMETADISYEYGRVYRRVQESRALRTFPPFTTSTSRKWRWQSMSANNSSFSQSLREHLFTRGTDSLGLRFGVSNRNMGRLDLELHNSQWTNVFWPVGTTRWYEIETGDDDISFDLQYNSGNYVDIRFYDLYYDRSLDFEQKPGMVHFYSRPSGLTKLRAEYTVDNLPGEYSLILRSNSADNTLELVDSTAEGGDISWMDYLGRGFSYIIASESTFRTAELKSPRYSEGGSTYRIESIHGDNGSYDNIILTHENFLTWADSLARLKNAQGVSSAVVVVDDVYREFGGSLNEPAAIRHMLQYKFEDWDKPSYLTLFGYGHYDYKMYRAPARYESFIPPYINVQDNVIEDFYTYLDPGENVNLSSTGRNTPDLFVGRIPVRSEAEAAAYMNKLEHMNSLGHDKSDWRNRVLLVTDDDTQRGAPENLDHWRSSDVVLGVIDSLAPTLDVQEINLLEYPFSGGGWTKPEARARFLSELNRGTMLVNFIGHGSYEQITDEDLFFRSDIPQLENRGEYFIFTSFSCAVSFFDDYELNNMGMDIVLEEGRGAVVSIASTREAFHNNNRNFGRNFFTHFVSADNDFTSVGAALGQGKMGVPSVARYALFGDPSYAPYTQRNPLNLSVENSESEAVDEAAVFDDITVSAGLPADMMVPGGDDSTYYTVIIQNPTRRDVERKDLESAPSDKMRTYDLPGEIIYSSGLHGFTGRKFSHTLQIPRSIAQDTAGAHIRAYVWNGENSSIAAGYMDSLTISGINYDQIDTSDTGGPSIAVRKRPERKDDTAAVSTGEFTDAPGRIVVDGFFADTSNPIIGGDTLETIQNFISLEILLRDSSGIDYFYNKPGEGISVEIEGVLPLRNLNEEFQPLEGNLSGVVNLFIPRSSVARNGEYTLTVSASDVLGNRKKKSYILDITSLDDAVYDMGEVFAYPSPVHMGKTTRFWFNEPDITVNRATLKIFTLDGQPVRTFRDVRPGVSWDLRDQAGNPLSPNVYLYRLYVERYGRSQGGRFFEEENRETVKSPIKKMIIYPPR
ncbi:MAG: C25 family cysteine peptidase [Fibrobacterota bacterium]